jgi:PAS domain S-box-containing protein
MESKAPDADTLYASIVEQAPDAIIFADRGGAIRVWNGGAEAIFGYAASEVLGESLDVIIPEPLRKAHWQGFDKALESGTTKYAGRVLTTRSVHKDGRRLYVDLSFGLVRDAAGVILGALAIGRDCTERYLAEKARASGSAAGKDAPRSP